MRRPEDAIQRAVFDHIRARGVPGLFSFHCPNGGKRSISEAVRFKAMGVRAGVPDVWSLYGGRTYALELKPPKGRLSGDQIIAHEQIETAGGLVATAYSLDAALACLEGWGLLRGEAR
jgi:hypothetical protein